jgi:hypothetical protein
MSRGAAPVDERRTEVREYGGTLSHWDHRMLTMRCSTVRPRIALVRRWMLGLRNFEKGLIHYGKDQKLEEKTALAPLSSPVSCHATSLSSSDGPCAVLDWKSGSSIFVHRGRVCASQRDGDAVCVAWRNH